VGSEECKGRILFLVEFKADFSRSCTEIISCIPGKKMRIEPPTSELFSVNLRTKETINP
jgi:hypothetical protein